MTSRPLPEGHHHLGSDISSLKASTSSNPRRYFPTQWKEPSLTQNSDWKSLVFLFPSTWPGFASLGQTIHPPEKPVLAISLPSSAVCVSPRHVLLSDLFVGVCSSHPWPFRKAPLVISFSCLRLTGLKYSSFWGTGRRPLITIAFNYSLTPSRGCQFKLDQTRGTFPRISMTPMLPRWLKLTCARGVGRLSPSQLHGVLDACVLSGSVVFPMQPHGRSPPAPLSMDFFFFNFPGKNAGVGFRFLLPGSSWPRDRIPGSCISCRVYVLHWQSGSSPLASPQYATIFFFFQDEALPTKPLLISPGWSGMHFCLGAYSSTLIISLAHLPQ